LQLAKMRDSLDHRNNDRKRLIIAHFLSSFSVS
jgi:hypothetical protein